MNKSLQNLTGAFRKEIVCILSLTAVVFLTHYFTVDWEMPAFSEHVSDAAFPDPWMSAREIFYANNMVYGPLHYVILAKFSPGCKDRSQPCPDLKRLVSRRIIAFRSIAAVMDGLLILGVFLFCCLVLNWPPIWGGLTALSCSLLPVTLFYSHTSNMDIPYITWLMLSLLSAGVAYKLEKEYKTASLLLNLLAGVLLAFSFCTKEQVYGLCVLPAFYYVWIRWKENTKLHHRLVFAFRPLLLWGIAFVITVVLIYCGTVGWDGASCHWQHITGSGKNNFFSVDSPIYGRIVLLWHSLCHIGINLDIAGLLFLCFVLILLFCLHKRNSLFDEKNKKLLLFVFWTFISQIFLYYQVLRRSELRYNIPTVMLIILILFYFSMLLAKRNLRAVCLGIAVFLTLQGATAVQFLYNLKNSPLSRLNAELQQLHGQKITASTASFGCFYKVNGGSYKRIEAVRSWVLPTFGLPSDSTLEILCDAFSGYWLNANLLILTREDINSESIREQFEPFFQWENRFDYFVTEPIPTLFSLRPRQCSILPLRTSWNGDFRRSAFAKYTFDQQLMAITFLLEQSPRVETARLAILGSLLKPYMQPHIFNCKISPAALFVVHDAYAAVGREADRQKIYSFILRVVPNTQKKIKP